MESVKNIVRNIITQSVNNNLIQDDDILMEHGVDSVLMIEIVMRIEERFNIEFSAENLNYHTLKSITEICLYVTSALKNCATNEEN